MSLTLLRLKLSSSSRVSHKLNVQLLLRHTLTGLGQLVKLP